MSIQSQGSRAALTHHEPLSLLPYGIVCPFNDVSLCPDRKLDFVFVAIILFQFKQEAYMQHCLDDLSDAQMNLSIVNDHPPKPGFTQCMFS